MPERDTTPDACPHIGPHVGPVCGMTVTGASAIGPARFDHAEFWFCSEECRRRFAHAPERYVSSLSFEPDRHASG